MSAHSSSIEYRYDKRLIHMQQKTCSQYYSHLYESQLSCGKSNIHDSQREQLSEQQLTTVPVKHRHTSTI